MMWIASAFLVGFLGSFHCAGMCGPIAVALPGKEGSSAGFVISRILYNGGRVFTYAFMGGIVGWIGHRVAIAGFQKSVSIGTGIFILLMVALPFIHKRAGNVNWFFNRASAGLKKIFRKLFSKRSFITFFLIGTANGLLPCGFVYLALAGSVTAGTTLGGLSYMIFFGLGTLPMMLSLSLANRFLGPGVQKVFRKYASLVAVGLAVILIVRGFTVDNPTCCHH